MRRVGLLLALPAAIAVGSSCFSATQVTVAIHTDVCDKGRASVVTIYTGATMAEIAASAPAAQVDTCGPGRAGTLVGTIGIVPRSADRRDAEVIVEVREGATCLDPGKPEAKGCIVARRKFRFQRGIRQELPITLRDACRGVRCGEDEACDARGVCVRVCEGCPDPNDPSNLGGGGSADGGGTDGGGLLPDGAPLLDGGVEAAIKVPGCGTAGEVSCSILGAPFPCNLGRVCSLDDNGMDESCDAVPKHPRQIRCDGSNDCGPTEHCCVTLDARNVTVAQCLPLTVACKEACTRACDCPPSAPECKQVFEGLCQGRAFWHCTGPEVAHCPEINQ